LLHYNLSTQCARIQAIPFQPRRGLRMWEDANYCWIVLCKNHWFHKNIFFRHRIPLGQTDAVTPLPPLGKHFTVRCDECRKTYTYKPKDVRKVELELAESFKPHPLFREDAEDVDSNRGTSQEVRQEGRPKEEPPQKEQLQGESRQEEMPKEESSQDESPQSQPPQEAKNRAKVA